MLKSLKRKIDKFIFNHTLKTYNSQKGQDYWVINDIFPNKKNGFFLEIGATNGIHVSNTLVLEREHGWKGICVEPSPWLYEDLIKNRNCICVNTCISDKDETVEFILADEVGGIIDNETDNSYERRSTKIEQFKNEGKVVNIKAIPLEQLLAENNAPKVIDYFSLDVEGAETKILRNFDFNTYIFTALTIERPTPELNDLLFNNGYVFVKNVRFDTFYVHKSYERLNELKLKKFEQVPQKEQ